MNSTPLELARSKKNKAAGHAGQIIRLLKIMGVPKQMLYVRRLRENGSFWLREINHLQVLEQARSLYRQQICPRASRQGGRLPGAGDATQPDLGRDQAALQGAWT